MLVRTHPTATDESTAVRSLDEDARSRSGLRGLRRAQDPAARQTRRAIGDGGQKKADSMILRCGVCIAVFEAH